MGKKKHGKTQLIRIIKIPEVIPGLLRAPIKVKGGLYVPLFAKSLKRAYFPKRAIL